MTIQFRQDSDSIMDHEWFYIHDQLQGDIYSYVEQNQINYSVFYHLNNNIYSQVIQSFPTLEEAKQFVINKFETYSNHPNIIYHPLYTMGWHDGWKKNAPNEQLELNSIYSDGYISGYEEALEQYCY